MSQKAKVVALGFVFNESGEILLTQRHDPDFPDAHLLWDVPGGGNEFGEKLEDTVKREVMEEAGATVTVGSLYPKCVAKTWIHKDSSEHHTLVFGYQCTLDHMGDPVSDPKITDMRWEKLQNLGSYNFLPTTKEFIELILAESKAF